jgi:hypothetical protein
MNEFWNKLHNFKRGLNLQIAARALALILLCLVAAVHVYYLVWLNTFPQNPILFWVNLILRLALAILAIYFAMRAFRNAYDNRGTARYLDLQTEHGDDLYQNLYELKQQKESEEVLAALATQAGKRLQSTSYKLPRLFGHNLWFVMLFVLAGIGSVWALSWDSFRYALAQFYTNKAESVDYKKTVDLSPGNVTVGKGQQLLIKVVDPDPRLKHRLFYRWDKQWRELSMADNSYNFPSLEYSIEYYVQNEVATSAVYRATCLDEPFARRWEVNYKYPPHTGLGNAIDTLGYGNIEAFKHSEAILSIASNIPVKSAVMRFSDGTAQAMQQVDATEFTTKVVVTTPKTWYLELTDELGRKSRPEEKTINVIPDNVPEIRIIFPGEDTVLNQTMLLPLIITANDDFGLRNLILHYQVNDRPSESLVLQSVISNKLFTMDYTFDLKEFNLLPGDNVTYWAEVFDNSPDRQNALSAKYKARFPSIEEIYREIERQENQKTEDLRDALEQSRDLQKDFEQKRRELLNEDNVQWEDKKQLEKMLDTQQQLSEHVENVAQDFQQMIDRMQLNDAVSEETLQKMQKIQELMQEISTDELRQAMSKFEQALQNIKPEDLRKAMENMKFSMEDFSKKIDQTLQLLESIKKEQALDKALQISKEMEKMQAGLQEKTGDPSENKDRLAREQENISDKFGNLQEAMEQAEQLLDPSKDKKIKQDMDDLQQDMQSGDLQKSMSQSQQQLSKNQRSAASQSQSQALEKMRQYTRRLGEMKSSMGGGSMQEVTSAMQKAIRELLIFSKQHESLKSRYANDPYAIMGDLIAQYEGIQVSLNRLFSIPQVTMFLPPKFYIDLTDTNKAYRDVFINVNEMTYSFIPPQLDAILRGINLMVYDLMQTLNNPSAGSGGGSGMQSLMQMLDQMSQEQMAMNMLTEQMMMQLQQQGGRMDAAMQQQIQKLASDQERLAENLKRALQNNPEAQKQGNSIKQIIEEAEAISRQLKNNQLSQDLLDRQENIISRLLDAQRSINKREFSERRKAETADPSLRQQETGADYETLRRKAMLDDSYRLFPPAYQQVILKYLKLLNE